MATVDEIMARPTLAETLKRLGISQPMFKMLDNVTPRGELYGNANTMVALIKRGMVSAGSQNIMTRKGYETLNAIRVGVYGCGPIEMYFSHAADIMADSADAGFCETGSETDIELSRASVYNTPRLFTGEPMNADSRRAEGVQRIVDKVNSRKGFPIATEQDTESTFFGSGGLTYSWWRIGKECRYQENSYTAVDGWEWEIKIEDPRAQFEWITVKLNHALILKAVRAISRLKLSRDSDAALKANKYMGDHVIQECRTWVFKGPDACDFDAGMADAVLQWACIGEVAYG